ncbi:MAG: Thermosome subunit alpha [Methanosaeta sp. PtaB.Bin039]|nr:MAG: Thermosome subunit alpha [Methanosaeta sp. PtaB.Bin039]OPY46284.1 MAG: Thermosome subunit alpha [Methanosaeta sp. PtaU1.Bin028]HOT06536.1 thermosome subunit alpha [Methanotrichaceae archaeon]HQF15591.1 thermosome subunit alpha [Methanotrichaceae archaeon]HQI90327.1 thermosome subunit alpha [Methanotrichaceae archaeon]
MAGLGGTPVLILKEGSQRTAGREAQRSNIMAAKAVASAVRTTLGPKGMDKMLVDTLGDVVITNDGVTILKEMDIEHPAAKMMVEIAKTQDEEVGDGTTTAVVLAGELLKQAEQLLEQEIHPTVIAAGYRAAAEKSMQILKEIGIKVSPNDSELLKKVAITAMTGKGSGTARFQLAELTVKSVKAIVDDDGSVDIDNITVEKKVGGSIGDSQLIHGMVIDKERLHPNMPKKVKDARIALLNTPIEIEKTEVDAKIEITSPDQLQAFLNQEETMLKDMVNKIMASGANVVFCQKGIDDLAQHFLAKAGIYTIRRVKKSDIEKLARATGARIVTSIQELSSSDLGKAGLVEERKIAGDDMTFVEECENPKSVSIILRGGTEHVVDELNRAMEDALRVVGVVIEDGMLVAGGGAPEVELALRLREYAATVGGREQLAIEAFADAMEIIPKTLAENAGLDQIDSLVALRSKHEKGVKSAGLDMDSGQPVDMTEMGVVEPLRVKTQAINSAADAAVMILRIDDVIASKSGGPGMPGGRPPGMEGGMGEDFD